MHGAHEIVHIGHGRIGRLDHEIDAFVEHVEVEVRRHYGDLAQFVVEDVKTSHFAVDPDQA